MPGSIRAFSNDVQLVGARREHIGECAAKCLVRQGYGRTSIREIAEACQMALGTLYHYVGSKEDILYLVINHGISRYRVFLTQLLLIVPQRVQLMPFNSLSKSFFKESTNFRTTEPVAQTPSMN